MKVNFHYVNIDSSDSLTDFINNKLTNLNKKYNSIINAEIHLKKENTIENDKICEIELSLPGPRVFASSKENNYELAVKNTISDLEIQLKKRKELNKPYV